MSHPVACAFCGKVSDFDAACEANWEPYFWIGDVNIGQPVCPDCQQQGHIRYNLGEYEIAHDFNGFVYRYDFIMKQRTDSHFYLQPPTPAEVDYLAAYRPGCTVVNCLQPLNFIMTLG